MRRKHKPRDISRRKGNKLLEDEHMKVVEDIKL